MQKVLALLSIVLVTVRSQNNSTCENLRPAYSTFKPTCDNNVQLASGIKMPDYEDQTYYYKCKGLNVVEKIKCSDAKFPFFCYVLQECVDCPNLIPTIACTDLPKEIASQCTPINGGTPSPGGTTTSTGATGSTLSTLPTPKYPSESTSSSQTTTTTKSTQTVTSSNTTATTPSSNSTTTTTAPGNSTVTPTIPTPPTIDGSTTPPPNSTDIPPPPSPSTQNTLIPLPPTPPPTPPNVSVDPPYVSPKPGS